MRVLEETCAAYSGGDKTEAEALIAELMDDSFLLGSLPLGGAWYESYGRLRTLILETADAIRKEDAA